MSDTDPNVAVMMQVPGAGGFVRSLVPVHLAEGHTVTFGVWMANAPPGWHLLAAPASAAVIDPVATPYVVAGPNPVPASVLADEWAHEQVLARLP